MIFPFFSHFIVWIEENAKTYKVQEHKKHTIKKTGCDAPPPARRFFKTTLSYS